MQAAEIYTPDQRLAESGQRVIIKYDQQWGEYQVPTGAGNYYYTDDREDAIETARAIFGDAVKIGFRRV